MLKDNELNLLLNKKDLNLKDLSVINDYLMYIQKLQEEYSENIDLDVLLSLEKDIDKIIQRLHKCRKDMLKKKLTVIK